MRKCFKKIATFSMVAVLGIGMVSPLNIPNRDVVTIKAASTTSLPFNKEDGTWTSNHNKWTQKTTIVVSRGKRYKVVTYTVAPKDQDSDLWSVKSGFKQKTSGIDTTKNIATQIIQDAITDASSKCATVSKVITFADIFKSCCVSGTKLGNGEIVHVVTMRSKGKYVYVKPDGASDKQYRICYQGQRVFVDDSMLIPTSKKQKDGTYTVKSSYKKESGEEMKFTSDNYFSAPVSRAIDFYTKEGYFAAYPTNSSLYYHKVGGINFYLDKEKTKVARTLVPNIPNLP